MRGRLFSFLILIGAPSHTLSGCKHEFVPLFCWHVLLLYAMRPHTLFCGHYKTFSCRLEHIRTRIEHIRYPFQFRVSGIIQFSNSTHGKVFFVYCCWRNKRGMPLGVYGISQRFQSLSPAILYRLCGFFFVVVVSALFFYHASTWIFRVDTQVNHRRHICRSISCPMSSDCRRRFNFDRR